MCLYFKDPTPRIAKRDIKCYKLLHIDEDGKYHPYFQKSYDVEFNTVLENDELFYKIKYAFYDNYYIAKGIFHTFQRKYLHRIRKIAHGKWILCKAIIPKGSLYYKGISNCWHYEKAYGSEKIIYLPKFYK